MNFLKSSRLPKYVIQFLIFTYLENLSISTTISLSKQILPSRISRPTIFKYFKLFSCLVYYCIKEIKNHIVFNGPVEVDETLLYRFRKGRLGRTVKKKLWVLGIIDRPTGRCIFYTMKRRFKWLVLSLIIKHVKPGGVIYTDCFSIYVNNQIYPRESYLESLGFIHFAIDHSLRKVLLKIYHL